jgi:hypothetical protein
MTADALHTKVDKSIQTYLGEVVLESPAGLPPGESNLYLVSSKGEIVWKAERPDPGAHFSRIALAGDSGTLSAYTTGGHACDLDLKTGRLIKLTRIQ